MRLFSRLYRRPPPLAPELADRLRSWQALGAEDDRAPLEDTRFVLVDVETSGLDPRRDRLIAIGAVPSVGDMDLLTDRIGALEGVERTTSSIVLSTKFER